MAPSLLFTLLSHCSLSSQSPKNAADFTYHNGKARATQSAAPLRAWQQNSARV